MAKEGDILSTTEQTHQQDLERLKALRYMDDDFMTVCLADNFEGVELILRIVLGQEDIKIKSIRTQEPLKNLQGRSAILDVHAIDSTKKEFDVEIQRSDAGAGAKRARHNSSLLDAHILKSGDDTEDIPDSYVIFITENDVMGKNQAIYHIQRYVEFNEGNELFGDGSHIIYVNGKYRGNDEVGKLMHDFSCTNPDDMNYETLAKRARYFKQDEKGVATMCKIMEDMRNEAAREAVRKTTKENARRLLKLGKIRIDEVSDCFPDLLDSDVKELEAEVMQLA